MVANFYLFLDHFGLKTGKSLLPQQTIFNSVGKKLKRKESHAQRFASLQQAYDSRKSQDNPPEEEQLDLEVCMVFYTYSYIPVVANYMQYKLLLLISYIAQCSCYGVTGYTDKY